MAAEENNLGKYILGVTVHLVTIKKVTMNILVMPRNFFLIKGF
jgi:hypothetical protein